jgi:hypothetical protein
MNYAKAKYYHDFFPNFREIILSNYDNLANMNMTVNKYIAEQFGLKPVWYRSSEMDIDTVREERVLDICNLLNAKEYISGNGAKAYQDESNFINKGIKLTYTDYHPVKYSQLWGEYSPNMSIIDFIMNCGYDWDYIITSIKSANANLKNN